MLSLPLPVRDRIDVWRLSLAGADVGGALPLLSVDERTRAQRFAFDRDRRRFVATRGWLRRLLGAYVGWAPDALEFRYSEAGKPSLLAEDVGADLRFNVSHSGDVALLAFALGRDVGVDVEQIEQRVDVADLARSVFSGEEQRAVLACDETDRLEMFFRYWTAKEAYIKAVGGGLSIPLQDFTVDLGDGADAWRIVTVASAAVSFAVRPLTMPTGYMGAVASVGTAWSLLVSDLPSVRTTAP